MKTLTLGMSALIVCLWTSPALAGGAFCTPEWRPENPNLSCASQIAISPGNDSRINLFLLLQDKAGAYGDGLSYPDNGWKTFYGRNFLGWQSLRGAWYPASGPSEWSEHYGTRCQTAESGQVLFKNALSKRPRLRSEDRTFLQRSREHLSTICDTGISALAPLTKDGFFVSPRAYGGIASTEGALLSYLEGSASFYGGEWAHATEIYAQLAKDAGDEWAKETALYMIARTALNQAIESGDDKWGYFDVDVTEPNIAARAEQGFKAYLAAYPEGRYASSARGLIRKALWMQRDYARLGAIYDVMLAEAVPSDRQLADLVEEVDDKFLIRDHGAAPGALLLAADNLMRMRIWGEDDPRENVLSAAALEAQADIFTQHPALYSFLRANHAFYVTNEYRKVLQLIPDAARADSYTPLAFSRQYLRGLALHALADRNEAGFWLDLMKGSKGIWQRPAVELALARNYEQAGRLDKVFTRNSPITDRRIRRILLGKSAGPDILKAQARDNDGSASERSFALFTVLLKQLRHREYEGFLEDYPLAKRYQSDENSGLWGVYDADIPPLDLLTKGAAMDAYSCPALDRTVKQLARDPRDVKARLCLGDFYRLNGFDDFSFGYRADSGIEDGSAVLGTRDFYPGDPTMRHDFYTSIISDRTASRDDRAYALYRAIRCYAPSNHNTCGGPGVDKQRRASWFRSLKRNYSETKWAQELEYYW